MRIVACLLLMVLTAGAAAQTTVDYDTNDNNLIDVRNSTQLQAITHDLTGVGNAAAAAYGTAFPDALQGMGCAATCTGYELLNDLDLADRNWSPIGGGGGGDEPPASTRYEAVFEGNGYVIRNMTVNVSHNHVGLFSALGTFGVIRSVGLVDAVVTGNSVNTGGLVGTSSGTIAASYVAGGTVHGVWVAGGLVGRLIRNAVVIASYADVSVSARSASGGLVGSMNDASIVSASYTIGRVEVRDGSGNVGGLAGERSVDNAGIQALQASYFDLERSGQTSCCGGGSAPSPDEAPRESLELRSPTTAEGIYAGWDRLNVDDTTGTVMSVVTLHDDAPWDFGNGLEYPVLRGVSARYPAGNSTSILAQRQRQSPLSVALSQPDALITEGSTALYAVELDGVVGVATMSWSVELTGVGAGHAEASDFVGATRGQVVLVNTASAVFGVGIARNSAAERVESFRVRLSALQAPDNVRLDAASSAVVNVIASHGTDYDADDNDLIDVTTTSQLAAIRHDLQGDGLGGALGQGAAAMIAYEEVFRFFDMQETCPRGCDGYELLNDLDLFDPSGGNWTPIGGGGPRTTGAGNVLPEQHRYNAVFEGNGHVIRRLKFDGAVFYHFAGLFRALGRDAVVRNVGLMDVSVDVERRSILTGALAGANYGGKIAASYVAGGVVRGGWGVGGLVSLNQGTIIASYSDVTAETGASGAGGLVNYNATDGRIIASYSLSAAQRAPEFYRDTQGRPNFPLAGGALVGTNQGAIESSYFDRERSVLTPGGMNVPSSAVQTTRALRGPTAAEGIYAAWDGLDVDNTTGTFMGVMTLDDDSPWDFGSSFEYPVLRGASARYPAGNSTAIRAQQRRQPPVLVTLSQRTAGALAEDAVAEYAVGLDGYGAIPVTLSWAVELTGVGAGHAEASDFAGATSGEVVVVNTDSAVFGIAIRDDGALETAETFRVRLSNPRGSVRLRLGTASSSVVSSIATNGINYDADGDALIEVATTSQLAAIRYDLGGRGLAGATGRAAYAAAFPFFDEKKTCPRGCDGYELLNDLDLFDPSGGNWTPIGGGEPGTTGAGNVLPEEHRYDAVFEGNGHVISRLKLDGAVLYHFAGLFRALGRDAVIRNVGLMDVNLTVDIRSIQTGALAGANYGGKIAASYVAGGVVRGGWGVGGLVSVNTGTIIASYSDVTAQTGASGVGGLVNDNANGGRIIASYSLGAVGFAPFRYFGFPLNGGGLAGNNQGVIESSYFNRDRSILSSGGANVPSSAVQTARALRGPTAAEGIYAAWDGLDVDNTTGTFMGVMTLDDDSPWDFGSSFDYPVLRGVSARYPAGNSTAIRAQQRRQSPLLVVLSQRTAGALAEDAVAEYAVGFNDYGAIPVTLSWAVELTGVGAGHAEASDFAGATSGEVVVVNTDSAVFGIAIRDDDTLEAAETFRVRLSNPRGSVRLRLGTASSSVVSSIAANGRNYDADGDALIEVATTSQLAAIRYDLGGRGLAGATSRAAYAAAFPSFDEKKTCPRGCDGYELLNDLDLFDPSGGNWTPIGGGGPRTTGAGNVLPEEHRYNAVFEGNGHVISRLKLDGAVFYHFAGLFRALGRDAVIRNVGLMDVNLTVDIRSIQTGALAGANYGGKIAASYVAGGVVRGGWGVGGLVSLNQGTIIASYSDVTAETGASGVGGLVNDNASGGKVIASYSLGAVGFAPSRYYGFPLNGGGLAGNNHSQGVIESSYFNRERSILSSGGANVPSSAVQTTRALRGPTAAEGIYAAWDGLDVDNTTGTFMDVMTLDDDSPWDFGSSFDYPVLRGVSARYPAGNSTAIRAQQRRQPPVLVTLSQRTAGALAEDAVAEYAVGFNDYGAIPVTLSWAVELTGVGAGHAEASDFAGATSGEVVVVNTDSAVFGIAIRDDDTPEAAETFRVRLSNPRGSVRLRLGTASSSVVSSIAANEWGQVTVAAQSPTVAEGATATFTLWLDGGGGGDVPVTFQLVAASEFVTPADLGRMTWVDRDGAESRQAPGFTGTASTGIVTLSMADIATVTVAAAADDVPGEGAERFGLRLTRCEDCGSVHLVEIGVPSSALVTIDRTPLTVSAQVYLEGAYSSETSDMKTTLAPRLPRRQPYGAAPWNHLADTALPPVAGRDGLRGVTSTAVDWVLVELRASAPDAGAGAALPTTGGFAAGLLLSDGRIAGINENATTVSAALSLDGVRVAAEFAQGADIYVLVHHRNHLAVMSAQPVAFDAAGCGGYCADFRSVPSYRGCAQLRAGGVYMMAAGDVNRSGVVSWGDDNLLLGKNYSVDADLDFSGRVSRADTRLILANHLLASECTP